MKGKVKEMKIKISSVGLLASSSGQELMLCKFKCRG